MTDRTTLEKKFHSYGFHDFKWADPKTFVVAHWVRMKCQFGCREYGHAACCPPNVPSVEECRAFFREYRRAVIFHFAKAVNRPQDRFAWTRKLDVALLKLEQEVFLSGYEKAFLLFLDSCNLCAECAEDRPRCKKPDMARPTADAMAMDVFSAVRKYGYPIRVLSDTKETMNRYAFLLLD